MRTQKKKLAHMGIYKNNGIWIYIDQNIHHIYLLKETYKTPTNIYTQKYMKNTKRIYKLFCENVN